MKVESVNEIQVIDVKSNKQSKQKGKKPNLMIKNLNTPPMFAIETPDM